MVCFIIAIDGQAASGKGTLAKGLAAHFGFDYLDTGLIYRQAAQLVMQAGIALDDVQAISTLISARDSLLSSKYEATAKKESLHSEQISSAAAIIAAYPEVRLALYKAQRDFVIGKVGAVIDGRDIGTVIFPEAQIKLFITANQENRAQRRFQQLQREGKQVIFGDVLKNLQERDRRDSERKAAPMVAADDAIIIDSSHLNAAEVLDFAISLCSKAVKIGIEAA